MADASERMKKMTSNPVCIRILLWIGIALFLLCFAGSSLAPDRVLPALGFTEYNGLIIRLYGIFQLSWATSLIWKD